MNHHKTAAEHLLDQHEREHPGTPTIARMRAAFIVHGEAASGLGRSAQALSRAAEHGAGAARGAASATEESASGVQTVAAAAEELAASVTEINRRVSEAADGRECLERLGQGCPDVILLDLMMPDMDGFETIEARMEQGPAITRYRSGL